MSLLKVLAEVSRALFVWVGSLAEPKLALQSRDRRFVARVDDDKPMDVDLILK